MINVAVVEDDNAARSKIDNLIRQKAEQIKADIQILSFANAESFLKVMMEGERVDILFCGVELNGMDGIELGKLVRQNYPDIYMVYVTSHSKYAAESYILDVYQYVLKQNVEERLPEILRQIVEKVQSSCKKYRIITTIHGQEKLFLVEIIYIFKEKGGKYVQYITTKGRYRERISMKDLLEQLKCKEFIIVDRGYIINMDHVSGIKGDTIFLTDNHQVVVSRGRSVKVKEQLNLYWNSCK